MKKLIMLVLVLLVLSGCKERIYTKIPDDVNISVLNTEFAVYDNKELKDIIESNVDVINARIDTNNLGEYEQEYYFTYNNKKYKTSFKYIVIDNESPKIFGGSSKTVSVNYKGELCNLVTYGDNYDSNPNCFVTGDYDLDNIGTYPIVIHVQDSSDNLSTHNISLSVVNNTNNNSHNTSTKKLAFSEAYERYKNDSNELGIDVSKWQGNIDFEAVKEAGVSFVMIRLGVKLNSGEEPVLDSYYLQNIKSAKAAGLKVGVYFYSKALSVEEAINESNWVLNALGNESLDLPVVFDWEIWSNWNSYHLSFHDLNEIAKSFIRVIEENGYKGMLYGSKFYLENFWDNTYDNIWLAHYVNKTSYEGYKIWQFSNVGKIAGINGDVDLDIMMH